MSGARVGSLPWIRSVVALGFGLSLACSDVMPNRRSLNGSIWMAAATGRDDEFVLKFTDSTVAFEPGRTADDLTDKYAVVKDTIVVFTEPVMRFLVRGDSLSAVPAGQGRVFRRIR